MKLSQAPRWFGAAVVCCCVAAGPAAAATPLGQLPPGAGEPCGGGTVFLQDTITGGTSYTVPAGGGVITAWATKANGAAGQSGALKVLRRDGGPDFTVVGTSALELLTASQTNTFPTRIAVAGGETLGYYYPAGILQDCSFGTGDPGDVSRFKSGDFPNPPVGTPQATDQSDSESRVNIQATLEPDADGDGFGDETQDLCVATLQAPCDTFGNPGPVVLAVDGATADPYPSGVSVTGLSSCTVSKVAVTLNNVNHGYPDDVDVLLVGPQGQTSILMSDTGGGSANAAVDLDLSFDDAAADSLPDEDPLTSGVFKPTDVSDSDTEDGPDNFPGAPVGPYTASLAVFDGTAPNGTWRLYVTDDYAEEDGGQITGGWVLTLQTSCSNPGPGLGLGLGPASTQDTTKPVVSALGFSSAVFRAAKAGPSTSAKAKVGTTVSFTLSEAGSVKFTVQRKTKGRKVAGKCVKPKPANRTNKACVRWAKVGGSFTVAGVAGKNSFKFRGRIAGKSLKPGRYRLNSQATDTAGNKAEVKRKPFKIVS